MWAHLVGIVDSSSASSSCTRLLKNIMESYCQYIGISRQRKALRQKNTSSSSEAPKEVVVSYIHSVGIYTALSDVSDDFMMNEGISIPKSDAFGALKETKPTKLHNCVQMTGSMPYIQNQRK